MNTNALAGLTLELCAEKRSLEGRPKTYRLTTNEQRRQLLVEIAEKGASVLKVLFFLLFCRLRPN